MKQDSGPQLVQKYCSEIELKTCEFKISIQVQWKPEEVEFHIAGLEEGVTRALHAIQEEFEVCDNFYQNTLVTIIQTLDNTLHKGTLFYT